MLPVDAEQLNKETRKDPELSKVIQYLQQGWPSKVTPALQPYHSRQSELTIEAGCVLWGTRVVIPEALQKRVRHCEDEVYCLNTCLVATGEQTNRRACTEL